MNFALSQLRQLYQRILKVFGFLRVRVEVLELFLVVNFGLQSSLHDV
jgi:hypothetical protein